MRRKFILGIMWLTGFFNKILEEGKKSGRMKEKYFGTHMATFNGKGDVRVQLYKSVKAIVV